MNNELNVYDCTEFTQMKTERLKSFGWNAKSKLVQNNCKRTDLFDKETYTRSYEIIYIKEVYVESITGQVITPQNYKDYGIKNNK